MQQQSIASARTTSDIVWELHSELEDHLGTEDEKMSPACALCTCASTMIALAGCGALNWLFA